MYSIMPTSYDLRINGFEIGNYGYFYDSNFETLLIGYIDKSGSLVGRVVHNGLTQKKIYEGRYFAAWNNGYSYTNWDKSEFEYVGKLNAYIDTYAYLDFIETASYDQIRAYFEAKELLIDNKKI